ncbi:MAG: hypothetical protein RIS52_1831 [Pseudomonadota bacterium]
MKTARTRFWGPIPLKLALLMLCLSLSANLSALRWRGLRAGWETGQHWQLPAFILLYAALACATFCAGLAHKRWARGAYATFFSVAAIAEYVFFSTMGQPPTFGSVQMLIASRDAWQEAASFQIAGLFSAFLIGLTLFLAIFIAPSPASARFRRAAFLPLGVLPLLIAGILARGGSGLEGAPPGWIGPAYASTGYVRSLYAANLPPVVVPSLLPRRGTDGDIVLIIDESIAANYLDINQPDRGVRSGLLNARKGIEIANFGVAASAANFSAGSNYILRYGGTRSRYSYLDTGLRPIWNYAHTAGYRTVHFFVQSYTGLQNLMTAAEFKQIDDYETLSDVDERVRDVEAAKRVSALLHNGQKEFILVNKSGAHFPAASRYPVENTLFTPTLTWQRDGAQTLTGHASEVMHTEADWLKYRNDYRNAIVSNVGHFFDTLLDGGLPAGSTIIYTSDHGEAMHERGWGERFPHGTAAIRTPEEGAVPLVALSPDDASGALWRAAAAQTGGVSHYQIFPTLLTLMGYEPLGILKSYGPNLLSHAPDPMTFNTEFYEGFGYRPTWRKIIRAELALPPLGDFNRR